MGRRVSAVLVTWNSAETLRRCLDGIAKQTHSPVELIVVDNASRDGSAEIAWPDAAHVIRNETNRGFSVAVNQGIAMATGELVALVNPDCYFEPDYIARTVAALEAAGEN